MPNNAPLTEGQDYTVPNFHFSIWHTLLFIGVASLLGLLLLWWDRRQAKKEGKRASELLMMVLGLFGGATAMWVYMRTTQHKIRYLKFKTGFPIMMLLHLAFIVGVLVYGPVYRAIEIYIAYVIIAFAIVNLLGVMITRRDKRRAKQDLWRVSEDTLMTIALCGGALGMFLSMLVMHHKTRHIKFMLGLPLILVAQVLLMLWAFSDYCSVFFFWFP